MMRQFLQTQAHKQPANRSDEQAIIEAARQADKEIKKLNRMIEMICEGYTFVKTQLPPYNKKEK